MPRGDEATSNAGSISLKRAALNYSKREWNLFPVAPVGRGRGGGNGKKPYPGTKGFKDASNDPEQISAWWDEKPDANIGLSCAASGVAVFDLDLDLDQEEDAKRWEDFRAKNDLPDTFTQRTPGGGLHFVYRAEAGAEYPSAIEDEHGKIADIKFNGYIVLAPSVARSGRRESAGPYETIDDRAPVSAPPWRTTTKRKPKSPATAADEDDEWSLAGRAIHEARRQETSDRLLNLLKGARNTLHKRDDWLKLGLAIHAGYAGTRWEREAHDAWIEFSERWEAPFGKQHADFAANADRVWRDADAGRLDGVMPSTAQMILSILPKLSPPDVRPVKPVTEPIPLDAPFPTRIQLTGLAGRIAELVRLASDRELNVFPEAAALMALSALAAPSYVIKGPQGKTTLCLYGLLLGGTGSGKEACRKAADMVLSVSGRRDELVDGIASDRALHRKLSDAGSSALSNASYGAMAMAIDESGLHLSAIRHGNNGHQQMLLALTMRLWGLGLDRLAPHNYADARNNIPAVEKPRLTMLWTSTPKSLLDATNQDDSESGQLNRFLVFAEEGFAPLHHGPVDRDALREPPEDVVSACGRFAPRFAAEPFQNLDSEMVVEISEGATRVLEGFRVGEVEAKRRVGGTEGESWARATEYALRVAGLLALSDASLDGKSENLDSVLCEKRHVDLAIQIVRRAVSGTANIAQHAGKSEIEKLKDLVMSTIAEMANKDGFANARKVGRRVFRNVRKALRDDVINSLIDDGEIIEVLQGTGGRPSKFWAIAEDT